MCCLRVGSVRKQTTLPDGVLWTGDSRESPEEDHRSLSEDALGVDGRVSSEERSPGVYTESYVSMKPLVVSNSEVGNSAGMLGSSL